MPIKYEPPLDLASVDAHAATASAAATSADVHANTVSARAVSISAELGSLLASASLALESHINAVSVAGVAGASVTSNEVSILVQTASAAATSADAHANAVSIRAVSISNELGSLLASTSAALEIHAVAASAAATSAINKAVSDNASLSAVLATSIQTASAAATAADTHANTVSARVVSVSAELVSLFTSVDNKLSASIQIASAAATSADAHANTVSIAAAAADSHANTVSVRAVSISAELASLVQIASLAATSADGHANTVSARVVSVSAELASLLASTSAAISAQIVSVKASISLEYMSQINKLSASIQTASTAATNADTHANTVSARAVSISAELASLVQIASLAATSADAHANTVSARAVSISAELASLVQIASAAATSIKGYVDAVSSKSAAGSTRGLQSVVNALSNRISAVIGGAASVTSTELSATRYITTTTQTDVDYTLVLGDALTIVKMSSSSAHNLTVPLNASVAFPLGTQIIIEQGGTATVTIVATGGVTLQGGPLVTAGQYATVVLIKQATDTWLVNQANTSLASAEFLSIMSAADTALSLRITSADTAVSAQAASTNNVISARVVSVSAELVSLMNSADAALSGRITSVAGAPGGASVTSTELSANLLSVSRLPFGFTQPFIFDQFTTDSDPGSGRLRLNNSTASLANQIYIDNNNALGNAVTAMLDAFFSGSSIYLPYLILSNKQNPAIFASYKLTSTAIVDGTGYRKVEVSYVAGAGIFPWDEDVFLAVYPSYEAQANAISVRLVSVSAELVSLMNSADAAVSAQAASTNNVISARIVSVSAELVSLMNSADAAVSAQAASTNNVISARIVSVSAELASLVQIASAAATSAIAVAVSNNASMSAVIKADIASVSAVIAGHKSFGITVESPSAAENICFAFTTAPRTISKIHAVVGGTTPSVTYNIAYGVDAGSTTTVTSTPTALTNTSTGTDASLKRVSIPASGFIVFKTTAQSGTVSFIHVTIDT